MIKSPWVNFHQTDHGCNGHILERRRMDNNRKWKPGEIIVMRGVMKGKLWWACPSYVVQDTPNLLARYWLVGTPTRSPIRRPTVQYVLNNHIELIDRNWTDHDVLSLNLPGTAHSIDLMWLAGTPQLRCWYVHLQEAQRRTSIGVDTMDQMLDIVISPNRKGWTWKDEDELNKAEAIGVYSHEKAASIWAEGRQVIDMLEANASPFCDGWESWRPPQEWGIPEFPDGWDTLPLE
jgi:predicted RNA-binding protein associated with RNAse of E/G family